MTKELAYKVLHPETSARTIIEHNLLLKDVNDACLVACKCIAECLEREKKRSIRMSEALKNLIEYVYEILKICVIAACVNSVINSIGQAIFTIVYKDEVLRGGGFGNGDDEC